MVVRYRGFIADSARWDGFPLRDDDIVITVPSKSGTTWMQVVLALLLFDGVPDTPIDDLSPWLDMHLRSRREVEELLAAQTHRRFIKTHTPLDGLPWSDVVTWVAVGRDPRDAFVSMRSHSRNLDRQYLLERRVAAVGDEDLADLPDRWEGVDDDRALVEAFLGMERHEDHTDVNLTNVLHHLRQSWDARHRRNVHLVHYADLRRDLPAQMRRLRDRLGLDLGDDRVGELAEEASLGAMRRRAARTAPGGPASWKDPAAFFRGGRSGDGAATMTAAELERYGQRCRELTADMPDAEAFLAWVHHGTGGDPGPG